MLIVGHHLVGAYSENAVQIYAIFMVKQNSFV